MPAFDLLDEWPVRSVAAAMIDPSGTVHWHGDHAHIFRLASLAKIFTAFAVMVAVEEETVSLDDAAGPPGATLRDLLSHSSGLAFDNDQVLAPPGAKRIYSNTGIEAAADHVAANAGFPFAQYLDEAVLTPLGLTATSLRGSPAAEVYSSVGDVVRFVQAILDPQLLSAESIATMTSVHRPELDGVVPGFGSQRPNPWGLGVEIRGHKKPHWTSSENSPQTWGHFGGAGTMLWHDPAAEVSLVALTDRPFDDWARERWPALSAAALHRADVAGNRN